MGWRVNRRDNTVTGMSEKLPRRRPEATTRGNCFQAVASQGGVITSISTLRKCQSPKASKRADYMRFPAERVPKLSIN